MVRPLPGPDAAVDPLAPVFAGCAVSVIWSPRFPIARAGSCGSCCSWSQRPPTPCGVPGASAGLVLGWCKVVHPVRSFPTTHRVVCGSSSGYGVWLLVECGVLLHAQQGDLLLEVVGRAERLVDRREAEVGDRVERPQRSEDRHPDLVGRDLGGTLDAQRVLHGLAEAGQVVLGDRPALAGLPDTGDRLLAVERLRRAGALEHGQLHELDCGEPLLAALASPPPADRGAVLGDAGVEDLGVGVPAVRAVHLGPPLPLCATP